MIVAVWAGVGCGGEATPTLAVTCPVHSLGKRLVDHHGQTVYRSPYHLAALLTGETGPLVVAFRLAPDPALADDLHAPVRANVANPTDDLMWGAPGTLLAASVRNVT